jgi:hypothetical protein
MRLARIALFGAAVLAVALGGCGTLPRNGVPPQLMAEAVVPDMPDVRSWARLGSDAMTADLARSFSQESPEEFPPGPDGLVRYAHLAISGGGQNGAFGAGLLSGWTESGTRPVFKIVTGVSTGALMAPFAFLGPDEDEALRRFYTTTSTRNVFQLLSFLPQLLAGESFADTGPLAALISGHVDERFLRAIAAAHLRGRRLYVGTADLDAQRFVVWNMGQIALSGKPGALELFRKVMLASASIPVVFPPVFFEVEAGGRRYDEMHVDGAVGARVFYTGGAFSFAAARERAGRNQAREVVYIIHNGQLPPVPREVRRSLRSIGARTMETTSRSGFVGDLFRIYAVTQREDSEFRWITLPPGVELQGSEAFDPVRMSELYAVGRKLALPQPPWFDLPPGFDISRRGAGAAEPPAAPDSP